MRAMAGMTNRHTVPENTQGMPDDNTSEHVNDQVAWWRKTGQLINVESAREISAWWATSGYAGRTFTAFASTGEILPGHVGWIESEIRTSTGQLQEVGADGIYRESHDELASQLAALHALRAYVVAAVRASYTYERFDSLRADANASVQREIGEAHCKAVGYVWGWQDGRGERDDAETNTPWSFGIAYGIYAAEYHLQRRGSMTNIHDAFKAWRNGGVID